MTFTLTIETGNEIADVIGSIIGHILVAFAITMVVSLFIYGIYKVIKAIKDRITKIVEFNKTFPLIESIPHKRVTFDEFVIQWNNHPDRYKLFRNGYYYSGERINYIVETFKGYGETRRYQKWLKVTYIPAECYIDSAKR